MCFQQVATLELNRQHYLTRLSHKTIARDNRGNLENSLAFVDRPHSLKGLIASSGECRDFYIPIPQGYVADDEIRAKIRDVGCETIANPCGNTLMAQYGTE